MTSLDFRAGLLKAAEIATRYTCPTSCCCVECARIRDVVEEIRALAAEGKDEPQFRVAHEPSARPMSEMRGSAAHSAIDWNAPPFLAVAEELDRLRDALDHIMRTARNGVQPTRRLDWIVLRAKYALEGKQWSNDVREEPRDSVAKMEKDNFKLRQRLAEAEGLLRRLRAYVVMSTDDAATVERLLNDH